GFNIDLVDLRPATAEEARDLFIRGTDTDGVPIVAAITWEPHLDEAKRKGNGHILHSSEELPNTIVDILTVEEGYLKQRPDNVKKLIRGWFRAVNILKPDNPQKEEREVAIGHVCRAFGMSRKEYDSLAPLSPCSSVDENIAFFDPRGGETNEF